MYLPPLLLRALVDAPQLHLRLLHAPADALDRPVSRAMTTDLLHGARYLSGGELVITGLVWRRSPADSEEATRQQDLARLSTQSTHLIAERSGHFIMGEQPELVSAAITPVVEAVRRQPVGGSSRSDRGRKRPGNHQVSHTA